MNLLNRRSLLTLLVILCLAFRVRYAYLRATAPFQMDYEEGNVLNAGLRILEGKTPYPTVGSFPYILNPYGPVGYLLAAGAIKLFGISLFGPRMLVLFAGIGIAIGIGALARNAGAIPELSWLSAASFLCSPFMWYWFPLLRVDLWAILFSLLGLCAFASGKGRWQIGGLFFALALLTKHTALAAPAACVLELWLAGEVKKALKFTLVIICGLLIGIGSAAISGDVLFHLFRTHPDAYDLRSLIVSYFFMILWSLLPTIAILYAIARGLRPARRTRLAWLYFAFCSLTALTMGKAGSNNNHSLEWTAAVLIIAAIAFDHLLQTPDQFARGLVIATALLIPVLAILPHKDFAPRTEQAGCGRAYDFIRAYPGTRVLSEDVSAVVLGGKPLLVSNPFVVTQLGDSVPWSNGSMESLVNNRYFDLILFGDDPHASGRWSPALKDAVAKNYKLERQFQCSPYLASAFVPK